MVPVHTTLYNAFYILQSTGFNIRLFIDYRFDHADVTVICKFLCAQMINWCAQPELVVGGVLGLGCPRDRSAVTYISFAAKFGSKRLISQHICFPALPPLRDQVTNGLPCHMAGML